MPAELSRIEFPERPTRSAPVEEATASQEYNSLIELPTDLPVDLERAP